MKWSTVKKGLLASQPAPIPVPPPPPQPLDASDDVADNLKHLSFDEVREYYDIDTSLERLNELSTKMETSTIPTIDILKRSTPSPFSDTLDVFDMMHNLMSQEISEWWHPSTSQERLSELMEKLWAPTNKPIANLLHQCAPRAPIPEWVATAPKFAAPKPKHWNARPEWVDWDDFSSLEECHPQPQVTAAEGPRPQVSSAVAALDKELEQDHEHVMRAVVSLQYHDDDLRCWPPPPTHSIKFDPFGDLDVQQLDGTSDYDLSPLSLSCIITPPNDITTVTIEKFSTPFASDADEIILDRRVPVELHVIQPPPTAIRRQKRLQLLNQLLAEIEEGAHLADSQCKCL